MIPMYSTSKHNINIVWIDLHCWELLEWWTLVQLLRRNPVAYLVLIIPFQAPFSLLLNNLPHPWITFLFSLFKDKRCLKHLELHYLVKSLRAQADLLPLCMYDTPFFYTANAKMLVILKGTSKCKHNLTNKLKWFFWIVWGVWILYDSIGKYINSK